MSESESGSGVQVLSVETDGTYRADEAALRQVAAHAAARGLPVAVVSVAGATRGGKSFLLDFFLRYLRAPDAARRSGAWIGADDEPLTGFSWRGGCERDTKGILIWSEPIVVTLGPDENSKKVAVVLMDTQGTFDSSSTVRDSSTIFAMSTLLSSVQIYNLSQNIKEDDLQYLQLFTEFGKLAQAEESEKPFQELRFLVRDWSYAYEHPVGAEGGQQLLDKRLEIHSGQAAELREIRAHVRGAFERVACFLLPHPGLTVAASPTFRGCPADISSEFKTALLELVPSLFAPENLTIKKINGRELTLQHFAEYFKTYTEIFNGDSIPTPMTVMQATSMASLELSLRAAREAYRSRMEPRAAPAHAHVPRGAVPRAHAEALAVARDAFAARRSLAAPPHAAASLEALMQELDSMLPSYVAINEGRYRAAGDACKAAYDAAAASDACLTRARLDATHGAALAAARDAFHAARLPPLDDDDGSDWDAVQKELEVLVPLYRERNESRIAAALHVARDLYTARVGAGVAAAACLHARSLRALHAAAARDAHEALRDAWLDPAAVPDQHVDALMSYIEEQYEEFEKQNDANNERVIEEAKNVYIDKMSEICTAEGGICLHPRDLAAVHERCEEIALAYFWDHRDDGGLHLPSDEYRQKLSGELVRHLMKFHEINDERNRAAVEKAHAYYLDNIAPVRYGAQGVLELFGPLDFQVFNRHRPLKEEAVEMFKRLRRPGGEHDTDEHLADLNKKIERSYSWLVLKLVGNLGFTGFNIAFMTSMLFFRR